MSWWIGAAVSGLAALGCGLGNRRQNQRLSRLNQARATTVEELRDLQATVAAQMGAGSFQEAVKLSGAIACESPLTAPWSGQSCVAYSDTTTRLVEEEKTTVTTDSAGVQQETTSWERRDEVISREARRTDFALVQGEYQIHVRTEGADLGDGEGVLHHRPPQQPLWDPRARDRIAAGGNHSPRPGGGVHRGQLQ